MTKQTLFRYSPIASLVSLATSGSVVLDFSSPGYLTLGPITGGIDFEGENYSPKESVTVRVLGSASPQNLTFPSGWVFVGDKPSVIAEEVTGVLTVTSFGVAEGHCVAAWSSEEVLV
jgi:hypothetical protein